MRQLLHAPRMQRISLRGVLDIYAMRETQQSLRLLDGDVIIIDLASVRLISAAFMGELVRLRKRLPSSTIRIVNANPFVRQLLEIVGFAAFLSTRRHVSRA